MITIIKLMKIRKKVNMIMIINFGNIKKGIKKDEAKESIMIKNL